MGQFQPLQLEQLSWTEAKDLLELRPVGILPVGAIEAHGPHLPLNSDVIIAQGMARYGARALYDSGLPAIVLPPISYSVSFAGACFSGTTPVGPDAFGLHLTAVLTSHARQGYRAICIANAHLEPAHIEALNTSLEKANAEVDIPMAFPDQREELWASRLSDEFRRGARHAGCYETSIILAEAPELVRRQQLEELEPVWIDLPAALAAGATNFAEAGAEHGYFGDPRAASPEHGVGLLTTLGMMIRESVLESLASDV